MEEYGELLTNVDLRKYTTLKVGGIAKYLIKPYSKETLINLLKYLKDNNIKYYILGNGSNVILDDHYFEGVIIKLDKLNEVKYLESNKVMVDAGVMLPFLCNKLLKDGYTSFSFASMIPGTIGASVIGNAGANGQEIMEILDSITVLDKDNNIKILNKRDISYGYRYTSLKGKYIILDATFIIKKGDVDTERQIILEKNNKRMNTQPLDKPNVGSIFRNPENASSGKLIEESGLKNFKVGGAKVSEKHANFIVNEDNATFDDILKLIDIIKKEIKNNNNIDLVLEPNIVSWSDL